VWCAERETRPATRAILGSARPPTKKPPEEEKKKSRGGAYFARRNYWEGKRKDPGKIIPVPSLLISVGGGNRHDGKD